MIEQNANSKTYNCMKRTPLILLILCAILLPIVAAAQSVTFDFAFHKDKPLIVTLKNGTINDTVFSGKTNAGGRVKVIIPKEYEDYSGMATVSVARGNLDFIVSPGENALVRCAEEYPHGGNTTFGKSPENESLQKWFMEQSVRQQKISLLSEIERAYDKEDTFYPLLAKEKKQLETGQKAFENQLRESPLYAACLLHFIGVHPRA
jgi:hypothetical protein